MKKKIFVSLLTLSLLTGCGINVNSSSSESSNESSSQEEKKYTLKEALAELKDPSSRYTLYSGKYADDSEFEVANATSKATFGPHYYTKNIIQSDEEESDVSYVESGYLEENGGVSSYTYDLQTEKLIRSELLTDDDGKQVTSLSEIAPSFNNVDASKIEVVDKALDFKGQKKSVLALFNVLNIPTTAIFYLESFKMEFYGSNIMNNVLFTAKINLKLGTGEEPEESEVYYYVATVQDFGKAQTTYLEDFLADPLPAYVPSDNEKRLRKLFAGKNYTQYRDLDGDDVVDQYDYFTDQYYYVRFTEDYKISDPSTVAQYGDRGYIAINNKTMNYEGNPLVFIGCYLFYGFNDEFQIITRQDPNNPYYAQSSFNQVYTDISYVMNYPNRMICLNDFQNGTVNDEDTEVTYTDTTTMNDFIKNFNLASSIATYKKEATQLTIKMNFDEKDEDCSVIFDLYIGEDKKSYFEYEFKDFGTTKVDFVEQYIADNELQMD